jgi:formate/nitrite transporter
MPQETMNQVDPYSPPQIVERAGQVGVAKANLGARQLIFLGILAGAFIGMGAMFFTNTLVAFPDVFGLKQLVGGLTFSLGLILVIIAGAELFTGNNLIVIASLTGQITISKLLRNWILVYLGNLIGSLGTVFLYYNTGLAQGNPELAGLAVKIAAGKASLSLAPLFFRAVLCNALVCLAVWLCISARSNTDKILSIIFPITAFVALGFEHCVANMYFIPFGYALQNLAGMAPNGVETITLGGMFNNIFIATIGNIFGGSVLVAVVYWFVYIKSKSN